MAKFYVVNKVVVGTLLLWPGSLVDDTLDNTTAMTAAGARLYAQANATVAAAAVKAQAVKARGGDIAEAESIMMVAADAADVLGADVVTNGNTVATNQAATATNQAATATNQAATATNVAEARSGHVRYMDVLAAENDNIVAAIDPIANGALTIAGQPDVPRKLQVVIVDANSSVSAGQIDFVGVGPSGEAVTESVLLTGGSATKQTTKAYAKVTSATVTGVAGAAAGDTVSIGLGTGLGLPGQKTPASSGFAVHKSNVDGVDEAVGTVDAAAGTIIPTTAPNGTRDFDFWYTYAVTVLQAAHNHTQDAHNHTQDAHNHTQDAHTHAATLS